MQDLEILGDGGVAVADGGSDEVRVFSEEGRHLLSFGRRGRGPGEFSGLYVLDQVADSLITYDLGNARVSVWRMDGSLTRSYSFTQAGQRVPAILLGMLQDGATVAVRNSRMSTPGLLVETVLTSRYAEDGQWIDSIARLPVREMYAAADAGGLTIIPAPFTAAPGSLSSLLAVDDDHLCHTFGSVFEFRCYDPVGRVTRIVRVARPPRPVSQSDIGRFWQDVSELRSGARRDSYLSMRNSLPFPAELPAFAQLVSAGGGRTWARVYAPVASETSEWLIFDEGRLVATVLVPGTFQIMDAEDSRVAGVQTDSLGVETVRIYEVRGT